MPNPIKNPPPMVFGETDNLRRGSGVPPTNRAAHGRRGVVYIYPSCSRRLSQGRRCPPPLGGGLFNKARIEALSSSRTQTPCGCCQILCVWKRGKGTIPPGFFPPSLSVPSPSSGLFLRGRGHPHPQWKLVECATNFVVPCQVSGPLCLLPSTPTGNAVAWGGGCSPAHTPNTVEPKGPGGGGVRPKDPHPE